MTGAPPLVDALVRLGHAQAKVAPGEERKHGVKARLFGDPLAPRRIGRFIDLGLLGHGAMGTVRRAYDDRLAREVAIKLVRYRSRPQDDERLLREAQALAQLSHPNVVQIYEVGEADDEIFIAMELVDGDALDAWQREPHPWRECVAVYLQAGRGLAAAHAAGLVHRDFKPSNCMRDRRGRVRVLDFGLARAIDLAETSDEPLPVSDARASTTAPPLEDSGRSTTAASNTMLRMQLTAKNAVVGTIAYMSPEQYVARPADAQSDQFSLCVALYEALYGQPPLGENPRQALLEMGVKGVAHRPAFPPTPHRIPSVLRRALQRGLAADPEARWPTMDALLHELERSLQGTAWRRLSLLAVVAGGAAIGTATLLDDDPCQRDRADLDPAWGAEHRREVHDALMAKESPYASHTWKTVERELDAYQGAWEDASLATCRASLHSPDQTARLSAQRRCLQRRRASLEYGIELLSDADDAPVEEAVSLVAGLPSVEACMMAEGGAPRDLAVASTHDEQAAEEIGLALDGALDRARTLDTAARYPEGLSVASEATALAKTLGEGPWLAEALVVEGHLLMSADQPEAAEAKLRAASTMALQHGSDEVVVVALSTLAHVIGVERARTEAGLLDTDFTVALAERPGVHPQARALALTSAGNVSTMRGELAQAQAHFERALELLEGEHGEDHLALVEPLDGLAQVLRGQGKLAQALAQRERALEIQRRWQGDQHPATAYTQANLASILYAQGQHARARQNLEEAITVLEQTVGADHSSLANPHNGLAAVLAAQGEHARAEQEYREAIRVWERALGAMDPRVAKVRLNLAGELLEQRKTESAIEEFTAVLHILQGNEPTPDRIQISAQALRGLGRLRFEQGDLPEAEARYREGITLLERDGAAHDPMLASLLNGLGHVVLDRGDGPGAETLHLRAKAIYEAVHGMEHLKVAHTHRYLARALIQQEQWDRAKEHVDQALALYATQDGLVDVGAIDDARRLRDQIVAR